MDAQKQNLGGNALAQRIKYELAENQHRFELHDLFADVTYRLSTAHEAMAIADKVGTTRFQEVTPDGKISQIDQVNGEWKREDGKNLKDVQAEIDANSLFDIEIRTEQRAAVGRGFDDTDKQMAVVDAFAFRRIQDPALQQYAASLMADNASQYPDYKNSLDKAIPGYPGVAEKVYELSAEARKMARDETEYLDSLKKPSVPASEAAAGAAPESETPKADTPEAVPETIIIDQATKDRLAGLRARDAAQVQEALGLNSIEPDIERKRQTLDDEKEEAKRAAWLKKADETPQEAPPKKAFDNKFESDEVFTATQEAKPLVPKEIEKQYLRVGDKYYHPKNADVLAFEDKGNKLETRSNSEQIAESMVRIAEARGWDEIKVSGSETFRREVWLEAASRGMHVKGYEPSEQDKAHLVKRSNDRQANHVENSETPAKANDFRVGENGNDKTVPVRDDSGKVVGQETKEAKRNTWNVQMAESFAKEQPAEAVKKYPELAGAYATVAAIDKKAEADGLDANQRAVVNAKVRELVTNSIERGDIPNTKLREEREVTQSRSNEQDYSR